MVIRVAVMLVMVAIMQFVWSLVVLMTVFVTVVELVRLSLTFEFV